MGTGDLCRVPPATARHGRAKQSSGSGPCADCRRFLWVLGPRGQYSGKIRFIEKPEYKTGRGVTMWLNVVLTPRIAYPEVKIQVWDLVRVVGIVAPFAHGGSVFGENSFYRAPWGQWAQETCVDCPQQRHATEEPDKRKSQAKFRDGTVWGLLKGPVCTWPVGSVFGGNSWYEKPGVQD